MSHSSYLNNEKKGGLKNPLCAVDNTYRHSAKVNANNEVASGNKSWKLRQIDNKSGRLRPNEWHSNSLFRHFKGIDTNLK